MTETIKEMVYVKGRQVFLDSIKIANNVVTINGKYFKKAKIRDEWHDEDIENPELLINTLKNNNLADIFTFWQRLPNTEKKYGYYCEFETIAALPLTNFEDWWQKISSESRNKVRKAEKKGIVVKKTEYDDDFIRGMMDIYNETPIRRGTPFFHYGKDFETLKTEWAMDFDKSEFIGAYYEDKLIGFIKLVYTDHYSNMVQFISKISHRDKYANNALMRKAVEICANKNVQYLTYIGIWRMGDHGEFQRRMGFEKINLPRYYIPLTTIGYVSIKLKLHKGIKERVKELLPEKVLNKLLDIRNGWYTRRAE